jgi:hypothetical protein
MKCVDGVMLDENVWSVPVKLAALFISELAWRPERTAYSCTNFRLMLLRRFSGVVPSYILSNDRGTEP